MMMLKVMIVSNDSLAVYAIYLIAFNYNYSFASFQTGKENAGVGKENKGARKLYFQAYLNCFFLQFW